MVLLFVLSLVVNIVVYYALITKFRSRLRKSYSTWYDTQMENIREYATDLRTRNEKIDELTAEVERLKKQIEEQVGVVVNAKATVNSLKSVFGLKRRHLIFVVGKLKGRGYKNKDGILERTKAFKLLEQLARSGLNEVLSLEEQHEEPVVVQAETE